MVELNHQSLLGRIMRILFLVTYLICGAVHAAAQEQMALKGVSPGMTVEEVEKVLPNFSIACSPPVEKTIATAEDSSCIYSPKIAAYNPESKIEQLNRFADKWVDFWAFYGRDSRIQVISLSFSSDDFSGICAALTAKYGKAKLSSNSIQNRMGAKYQNTVATWQRGSQTLTVERYANSLDRALVVLADRRYPLKPKPPSKDL